MVLFRLAFVYPWVYLSVGDQTWSMPIEDFEYFPVPASVSDDDYERAAYIFLNTRAWTRIRLFD